MLRHRLTYLLLFLTAVIPLGCKQDNSNKKPEIAVANSYLLCVVKDLCGNQTNIISLVPPGMCPGHFDIQPSQVQQLNKCKVLLLFDFQSRIGDALSRIQERGLNIYNIEVPEGLCLPETYLAIARSVADALSQDNPSRRVEFDRRLELIENRLSVLGSEIHTKMEQSGLKNAAVLVSGHQAVFAEWLSLEVIATFSGSDIETPTGINESLRKTKGKDIKLVIANQQEGTELAAALAQRLNAKMVAFSNFPLGQGDAPGFDSLLLENVSELFRNGK